MTHQKFEAYVSELKAELPRFAIRFKNQSWVMRVLGWLLFFNRRFMTSYTTTMFGKVYFPSETWLSETGPLRAYRMLRHEAVHLRDARRFPILFQLTYLLILPTVFTMRAFWEYRAYKESIRVVWETEGRVPQGLIDVIVKQFTTAAYLWMFPFGRFLRRRFQRFGDSLRNN